MLWEWLLRRKVRRAQLRYEQGRGHLACNGRHI